MASPFELQAMISSWSIKNPRLKLRSSSNKKKSLDKSERGSTPCILTSIRVGEYHYFTMRKGRSKPKGSEPFAKQKQIPINEIQRSE